VQLLGVLGGTFDPVHCGHLRLAVEVREQLSLSAVHLIPCANPPHRGEPKADPALRLRMLHGAIQGDSAFVVDDREMRRAGPSYTVDTLQSLRADFPDHVLCLILGMDVLTGLPQWHRWQEILDLAHLAVGRRPGTEFPGPGAVADMLARRQVESVAAMGDAEAGKIIVCDIPALDISASQVRQRCASRRSVRYLVPDCVATIIDEEELYQDEE